MALKVCYYDVWLWSLWSQRIVIRYIRLWFVSRFTLNRRLLPLHMWWHVLLVVLTAWAFLKDRINWRCSSFSLFFITFNEISFGIVRLGFFFFSIWFAKATARTNQSDARYVWNKCQTQTNGWLTRHNTRRFYFSPPSIISSLKLCVSSNVRWYAKPITKQNVKNTPNRIFK